MDTIQEVYVLLFNRITKHPNNYKLTKNICGNIITLDVDHANFLLGLIYNYYVVENNKKNVSELDLVKKATAKSNILSVPYGGKTHDNGKGPDFKNISSKFPTSLMKLICSYMEYISES